MTDQRKFALIVGVEEYEPNSGIANLKYAERDAVDLARALKKRCAFDQVVLLAGRAEESRGVAEYNAILDQLEDLAREMTPNDLFLFAFFGHGMERVTDSGVRSYLLPADARIRRPNTFLEWDEIRQMMDAMPVGRRVILLDCCRNDPHAGRGDADNLLGEAFARDITTALKAPADVPRVTAILTACDRGERAYEWDKVGHGVFAWHVLEAIEKGGWQDDMLTVNGIGRYVQERLRHWPGPGKQTPQYRQSGGAEVICLARRQPAPAAPRPAPVTPVQPAIREFELEPFEVEPEASEPEATAAPVKELPPVPTDIRELQARLYGVEKAIRQLEERTHPALRPALEKIEQAQRQRREQEEACRQAWKEVGRECPRDLVETLEARPDVDVLSLDPPAGISRTDFVDLALRTRAMVQAEQALARLERDLEEKCAAHLRELTAEQEKLARALREKAEVFLKERVEEFIEALMATRIEENFPTERFLSLLKDLRQYDLPFDDDALWRHARQLFEATRERLTAERVAALKREIAPQAVRLREEWRQKWRLMPQKGHARSVTSVAWSPDGRFIASGSSDDTVRIWEAETGRELRKLQGHKNTILSVAWSPDGRLIASGSQDETIRIWEAATELELRELKGHKNTIFSVAWSPDGRFIASGTKETIRIWKAETGRELRELQGHESSVNSVAWSPDGRFIASGSWDRTVRIWEAETGWELRKLQGHESRVNSVAWSPDGRFIASGSNDKTIRIWEAETGRELRKLQGHEGWVNSVAWSPDGRFIASGSDDKTVRIWEATTGRELCIMKGHKVKNADRGPHLSAAIRILLKGKRPPDWFTAGSFSRYLWKVLGHKKKGLLRFWSSGLFAASHSDDCLRIWDPFSGKLVMTFETLPDDQWVAWTPEGDYTGSEKVHDHLLLVAKEGFDSMPVNDLWKALFFHEPLSPRTDKEE